MSKEKSKRKQFTEADFNQVRLLLDAKIPDKTIEEITHRTGFIVKNIKKHDMKTFEDYRAFLREHAKRYFNNKPLPPIAPNEKQVEEEAPQEKATKVVDILMSIDESLK